MAKTFSSQELFLFRFSIFVLCKQLLLNYFQAFICLIRKNLTNIFKTSHHVEENSFSMTSSMYLAPVVQKVDNAIRWINLYPVDSAIGFPNTFSLDSDLSSPE